MRPRRGRSRRILEARTALSGVFRASLVAGAAAGPLEAGQLPGEAGLGVVTGDEVVSFWTPDAAPDRWLEPDPRVAGAVRWETVAPGVERGELRLAGGGSAWRLRLVLVRLDPERVRFEVVEARDAARRRGAWSVERAPVDVGVAVNAGQFRAGRPWGWVVRNGTEVAAPERAPLGMAFVVDQAGGATLVQDGEIEAVRDRGQVVTAFQSYPAVLVDDGRVPEPLLAPGRGVDLTHRDARLAVGQLRDGRLLVVLTRFDALGEGLGTLPFGPTTPEMAAILGALGACRAVLLDGGLSAQMALVDAAGARRTWSGLRRVPLGLVARAR